MPGQPTTSPRFPKVSDSLYQGRLGSAVRPLASINLEQWLGRPGPYGTTLSARPMR